VTERYAAISGVGEALPDRIVPNAWFEDKVETSDQWIRERTGIRERRFASPGESTGTLATIAGRRALARAMVDTSSVDLLIVATCTPERLIPSTAAFVQARLGLTCPSFDLNAACAGFVYALSVADAMIRAGSAERVLVVGAEVLSRVLDLTDRTTCVLFGDGAGAVVLEASEEPGVLNSTLSLDGEQAELLTVPAGGSGEPITAQVLADRRNFLRMLDGQAVFKQAVTAMADACRLVLEKSGLSSDDVRHAIGHQANARILTALGRRLGLDPEQVIVDIAKVGNTSAASIPIALARTWASGRIQPGDIVLTAAFGAGMAWGANVLRWTMAAPEVPLGEPVGTAASAEVLGG
jgi:3-oxoacyl-[acyl-carrier-protein] synthase-3